MCEFLRSLVHYWGENPDSFANFSINFFMMLIAGVSAAYAFKAYRNQRGRGKKEAACKLAKYYAENIIARYSFILSVYSASGYTDFVKKHFPMDKISDFTSREMDSLLENSETSKETIMEKMNSVPAENILFRKLLFAKTEEERASYAAVYYMPTPSSEGEPSVEAKIVNGPLLINDFNTSINKLLNDLEWFSMECRYGVADEALLYQSLHQTFLSDIQMLYCHISHRNINSEDKLYTNVIWLFQLWSKRYEKYRKRNNNAKEKAERRAQKYKEIAEKIAFVHHGKKLG